MPSIKNQLSIDDAFKSLSNKIKQNNQEKVLGSYAYLKQYEELHKITNQLPGRNLLDWGAGYGHFAYVQSKLGKNIEAYSPVGDDYTIYTETLINMAKDTFNYKFSKEPILLPYEDSSFDITVSCGVLEHVREFEGDDVKSLSELYRVLVKGGYLVIGHLPNKRSWIEAYSRAVGRTHHTFLYTKTEILKKATDAGFIVKKYKRYGFMPKNQMAYFLLKFKDKYKLLRLLTNIIYGLDQYILSRLFSIISQNHLLILQKPFK